MTDTEKVSRTCLFVAAILLAMLFQGGCGRERRISNGPPDDLIAYGLEANKYLTNDAGGDQPIVAGTAKIRVSGMFWSMQPIKEKVLIKIQTIISGNKLLTMDSGIADVQRSSDNKHSYGCTFKGIEKPGMYIVRVVYGSNIVDEALLEIVKR